MPLGDITAARRLAFGPDPLCGALRTHSVEELGDQDLAALVGMRQPGGWALAPDAIHAVRTAFEVERPRVTIEFGSGLSTICLAYFASRLGRRDVSVISLDQDEHFVGVTRASLRSAGLAHLVEVIHAPLRSMTFGPDSFSAYSIPSRFGEVMGERKAQLVLVDGPAAESGARFATLPLVQGWLDKHALVLLDDALRDGELDTASRWAGLGWIHVEGLSLTEKGLLYARVTP